jgi:dihydrofolate synthase/folylpolyglutamate synthase
MSYKDLIDKMLERSAMFQKVGASAYNPDLSKIQSFSDFLGNPDKSFKSIHVAGTNGKGSTSHIIASILQTSGFKVGLFTSPHYLDIRERIKINGEYIPEINVLEFLIKTEPYVRQHNPSFFELMTAMAFDFFKSQKVDFAVIEVGMGGRLDATNIITPILSVITNIDYDHEQFLGNTKALIATMEVLIMTNFMIGLQKLPKKTQFLSVNTTCQKRLVNACGLELLLNGTSLKA